jgi:hypothetical protein
MRRFAFLAFALIITPSVAQDFSDPTDVIEALYAGYGPAYDYPPDQSPLFSKRLNGLYEADAREANGEIGRIDFDPFINGQDYQLSNLEIDKPYLAGGRAVVRVSFENMGTPNEVGVLLVREGSLWKIDDVWNGGEEYSYDLLDILQAPMP